MKVNVSDKLSSEIRNAIQETGQDFVIVLSRFTDIETDKYLVLIRECFDSKYIGPVIKKSESMGKPIIFVVYGEIVKSIIGDITKLLMGCLQVNIPVISLLTAEQIGIFVKNVISSEKGSGSFNIGEIQFTPSFLVDKAGINITQATQVIEKFPSLEDLKQTKLEDLTSISGIGKATAKKILEALK